MKDEHSFVKSARRRSCDGFRERGAAICVKDDKEEEVLLVTSKRDAEKWVIPGGGVEAGETVLNAAAREVFEEAGVKGVIVRALGVFQNETDRHRTSVFVLRVSEELHDWEDARRMGRKRRWFPIDEARMLLGFHKPSQQAYLDSLKTSMASITTTAPIATNGMKCPKQGHNVINAEERIVNDGGCNCHTGTR